MAGNEEAERTRTVQIGEEFPNISCTTSHGIISSIHDHFGHHWALVVTQPLNPDEGSAVVRRVSLRKFRNRARARRV